ncbi:MAG: hypothetical protein J0I60_10570 [Nitrosospira sp.]|nr:hypothetical protein [Nitrosospira sp.]
MRQSLFHVLMVCLFLPLLWVIAISLNKFGFPLMEQFGDKSAKFFIVFPYILLTMVALYGAGKAAARLSGILSRKYGKPEENSAAADTQWDELLDPQAVERNRSIFMKNVDSWLKNSMLARVIFGLVIGAVLVM